jgi:hypothetical protein
MNLSDKTILIISPEAWGVNFVSKHHYANYLSKNNKVYFLNPAVGFRWNLMHNFSIFTNELNINLSIVSYSNFVPRLNFLPRHFQSVIYKRQARFIQRSLNVHKFDLIWTFDPFRYWDFEGFFCGLKIYHAVDFHPQAKFESVICSKADVVLGVASAILEPLRRFNTNLYKIPHGADLDSYSKSDLEATLSLPGKNKYKIGYVGNLNQQVDYDLLNKTVSENLQCDFFIIGPYQDNNLSRNGSLEIKVFNSLSKYDNLFFLGSKPANELIHYLERMDINIVLYRELLKNQCNSHKLMGYFYSGKVIVSTFVEEYNTGFNDMIVMTKNNNEFPKLFKETIANINYFNSRYLFQKRRQYAIENSYENLIENIGEILNNLDR